MLDESVVVVVADTVVEVVAVFDVLVAVPLVEVWDDVVVELVKEVEDDDVV